MRYGNPMDTAFRGFMQVFRATVNKINDATMMQESSLDSFHSHKRDRVEAPQNYGFSSAVLPRDDKQGQNNQQQTSGGDYSKSDIKGESAEAMIVSPGGSGHWIALAMDDRRHRPRNLPDGASIQYGPNGYPNKDNGHTASYIKPGEGIFLLTADNQASLRHVNKKKQPRPQAQNQGQGQQQQQEEEYKHEGDSVNTEVRCTKDAIEFYVGGNKVAYIQANKFATMINTYLGDENAKHPVLGDTSPTGGTVSKDSKTVFVTAEDPASPTSKDTQP